MTCEVEYSETFGLWWETLDEGEQISVSACVELLERLGIRLGFPHSSAIIGARHAHMRELRVQHQGRPLRILYAFDPRRTAILLLAGDKTADKRWYDIHIPIADRLYDEHLQQLQQEGLL